MCKEPLGNKAEGIKDLLLLGSHQLVGWMTGKRAWFFAAGYSCEAGA